MQAIEFPQQHTILAKDQPEYIPLPVHLTTKTIEFDDADGQPVTAEIVNEMTACFQLEPEEITCLIATGQLWHTQVVGGRKFQPIRMSVVSPFEKYNLLPDEWLKKLCDRMGDVVKNVACSEKERLDFYAQIAAHFDRMARPCTGGRSIRGAVLPGHPDWDAVNDAFDKARKENEIKHDGNGKQ
jgi:hypothetical protein